jgi:hypothetical protein
MNKLFNEIIPEFPRTRHLRYNALNLENNDLVSEDDYVLFKNNINITEKVDGSNCAISYVNGYPVVRNKDKFIKKSSIKEGSSNKQFSSIFNWFYKNKNNFEKLKTYGNFTIYGEWLLAAHGILYDKLPDYFLAYDLYSYEDYKFLNTKDAYEILNNCGFNCCEILFDGKLENLEELNNYCNRDSLYSSNYKSEGIYIKIYDKYILDRLKMVAKDFVRGQFWDSSLITKNKLSVD